MIDTKHVNALEIINWFNKRSIEPVLCDEIIFSIYKDVCYRGEVTKSNSLRDRINFCKIQMSFIRKNVLGLMYVANNKSAKGIKQGYVYAIKNKAWPDYVKIGSSIDVYDRLSSYQTSSPLRDYELVGYVYSEDRLSLEKELLFEFERNGEWIKADYRLIKRFMKDHEKFPDDLIVDFCTDEVIKHTWKYLDQSMSEKLKVKFLLKYLKHSHPKFKLMLAKCDLDGKNSIYNRGNLWFCRGTTFRASVCDGDVKVFY